LLEAISPFSAKNIRGYEAIGRLMRVREDLFTAVSAPPAAPGHPDAFGHSWATEGIGNRPAS